MLNLAQVIKGLQAERTRAQKEVDRLEKAITALGKLDGNPERRAQRKTGKRRKLTAAARKRISQAQRARWAKIRQQKVSKG